LGGEYCIVGEYQPVLSTVELELELELELDEAGAHGL